MLDYIFTYNNSVESIFLTETWKKPAGCDREKCQSEEMIYTN